MPASLPDLPDDLDAARRCRWLIAAFYVFAAGDAFTWTGAAIRTGNDWSPRLGIWVTKAIPAEHGALIWSLAAAVVMLSALTAAVVPGWLAPRITYCLSLLLVLALYMDGRAKIDHGYHTWWWASFVLMFVPLAGSQDDVERRRTLSRFMWTILAMSLLLYTLSGTSKLLMGIIQMGRGEPSWLEPGALAAHVSAAPRSAHTLLGSAVASHPVATYPLQLGVLVLELVALLGAFRLELARPVGISLVLLHMGINLTMGIAFRPATVVLLLFVVLSPAARRCTWSQSFAAIPLLGRRWREG